MQWSLSNHALATATTSWKKQWLNYYAKQQLCTCSTHFCTFLSRVCTTSTWNSTFTKNLNTPQRIFPSLSELMTVRYKILGNHFFPTYTYLRLIESPVYNAFRAQFPDMCTRLSKFVAYRLPLPKTNVETHIFRFPHQRIITRCKEGIYRWDFCTVRCRLW